MKRKQTTLPGCYELFSDVHPDPRGVFVKTFHRPFFARWGLQTDFREEYYTVSHRGVLRGLHFQVPPHGHAKVVYCAAGRVLDALVDLRIGSPTYGRHALHELSRERGNMLYIPEGMAHGFLACSEEALVVYNVTSVHSPDHDSGIRWNSAGIPWPEDRPRLSKRDKGLTPLEDFASPFFYQGEA
ncbi:MAG: dTDP-4-dehydrorhamnose 3,5-epimerase family protein [Deltaproteobacteria bacterium]|nr:dTDP-4-dehydrorhamnose 3,5-epimerase family protein [Deltaproteobacteria bacterium]